MSRCQSDSESSSTVAAGRLMIVLPPTAFTRMSMRPSSRATFATISATCAWSRASPREGMGAAARPLQRLGERGEASRRLYPPPR